MTWTDDLARIRYQHVPELAYARGFVSPIEALAVGWLGDRVPSSGAVGDGLLAALEHFSHYHYVGRGELGLHTCEICGRVTGGGEFLVETPGISRRFEAFGMHEASGATLLVWWQKRLSDQRLE